MAEQYYGVSFFDPATPGFVSGDKLYIGTLEEIRTVMKRLDKIGEYKGSVEAWKQFCAGNRKAQHNVAYRDTQLLTPAEYVCSSQLSVGEREWDHFNIWGFPYHMRFDEARISQLIIRYEGKYHRLLRAWVTDLKYKNLGIGWSPLNGGFWGNGFLLDVSKMHGGHFILNNLLYIEEDTAEELSEYDDVLLDPEKLIFDKVCDEIFADG